MPTKKEIKKLRKGIAKYKLNHSVSDGDDLMKEAIWHLTDQAKMKYFLKFSRLIYDLQVLLSKKKILKKLNAGNRKNAPELLERLMEFFESIYRDPNMDVYLDEVLLRFANDPIDRKEFDKALLKYCAPHFQVKSNS